MTTIRIGISPCPNDTYIFDAIHAKTIDCLDYTFEFIFEDVQTLNEMALHNELDVVKISYANYFSVMQHYILLRSGGALGHGVGPLLISKKQIDLNHLDAMTLAIPGKNTTANFLLHYALPNAQQKIAYSFSNIEDAVLNEKVDAGVIIHENRFTYQSKGLHKLMDLGDYWESETQLPIPLGGIAIRRAFNAKVHQDINQLIINSIQAANKNYPSLTHFITSHAQEMNEDVMKQHIQLYVNENSIDIGHAGEKAVETMSEILQLQTNSLPYFINKQ